MSARVCLLHRAAQTNLLCILNNQISAYISSCQGLVAHLFHTVSVYQVLPNQYMSRPFSAYFVTLGYSTPPHYSLNQNESFAPSIGTRTSGLAPNPYSASTVPHAHDLSSPRGERHRTLGAGGAIFHRSEVSLVCQS